MFSRKSLKFFFIPFHKMKIKNSPVWRWRNNLGAIAKFIFQNDTHSPNLKKKKKKKKK